MQKVKLSEIKKFLKHNPNGEYHLHGTRGIVNSYIDDDEKDSHGEDLMFYFKGQDYRLFTGDNWFSLVSWPTTVKAAEIGLEGMKFLEQEIEFDCPKEEE